MFLFSFLVLNILCSVSGDIRVPVLTAPLSSFNSPMLDIVFVNSHPDYYGKVTTYDVWQTPTSAGDQINPFDTIVKSTIKTIFADASVRLDRGQLSVAILDQRGFFDCPVDCYFVKDADILAVTRLGLTAADLAEVGSYTVQEMHEFAVAAMEQKFCFNMTALEQKLNLSSLRSINDQWPSFVPHMVNASVKCRADRLGVTVDELAGLLNTNTSTLLGYDMNQTENIFFRDFDDLVHKDLCLISKCDVNANCTSTVGSFNCTCHSGYTGNGLVCVGKTVIGLNKIFSACLDLLFDRKYL